MLIVDDEPLVREAWQRSLKRLRYQSDQAASGEEALQMAKHKTYDFILTDMQMPGMDGLDLARRLTELGLREKTALIGITGGINIPFEAEAWNGSGLFDDYLYKPFKTRQLGILLRKNERE